MYTWNYTLCRAVVHINTKWRLQILTITNIAILGLSLIDQFSAIHHSTASRNIKELLKRDLYRLDWSHWMPFLASNQQKQKKSVLMINYLQNQNITKAQFSNCTSSQYIVPSPSSCLSWILHNKTQTADNIMLSVNRRRYHYIYTHNHFHNDRMNWLNIHINKKQTKSTIKWGD